MFTALPPAKILTHLSLDVVLAALALNALASELLAIALPYPYYVLLALVVISIYSTDHALDILIFLKKEFFPHHTFKKLLIHPKLLLATAGKELPPNKYAQATTFITSFIFIRNYGIFSSTLALFLAWYTYQQLSTGKIIVRLGGVLSLVIIGYFYLVIRERHFFSFIKEILVTFIFSAGILLAPATLYISHSTAAIGTSPNKALAVLKVGSVCYLLLLHNALLFSYFRAPADKLFQRSSLILSLGEERSRWLLSAFGFLALLTILYLLQSYSTLYKYYPISALIMQGIFLRWQPYFKHHPTYFNWLGNGYFALLFIIFYFLQTLN